jgi:hypothetical protein
MRLHNETAIANRYELEGLVETYGPVEFYRALDTQLSRPVTVQMLTAEGAADPQLSRAFLRHQQIASSIHNCPLLAVYDAGTWQGRPFSVMERDKGSPPAALFRPGYPPDVSQVLGATRQIAESLQCCRDAGLTDWTFSPQAVRVLPDGTACLAIIEGLQGDGSSSSPATDAAALNALMRLILGGRVDAREGDLRAALVPPFLVSLVERLDPRRGVLLTAGEVAGEIAATEDSALQRTEAYVPGSDPDPAPDGATLVLAPLPSSHDAPTLAVAAIPLAPQAAHDPVPNTSPALVSEADGHIIPYTPPDGVSTASKPGRERIPALALLAALLALLLFALAGFALVRGRSAQEAVAAPPASAATATVAPPALLAAPVLLGKRYEEAQQIAADAGLNVAAVEPVYDGGFLPDTIAHQVPEPGAQVSVGSIITVSLSLGPEPKPTTPVEAPEQPAVEQAPAPSESQPGPKKSKKEKKDDDDDDD